MSRIDEINDQIKALEAERAELARTIGQPIVFEKLAPLFEFPGIESVYWTQFTPFWNDGDTCEFGVYFEPTFNKDIDGGYEDGFDPFIVKYRLEAKVTPFSKADDWSKSRYSEEQWDLEQAKDQERKAEFEAQGWTLELAKSLGKTAEKISKWMNEQENFLLDTFGDHVFVHVTKDGTITTDDYYHD